MLRLCFYFVNLINFVNLFVVVVYSALQADIRCRRLTKALLHDVTWPSCCSAPGRSCRRCWGPRAAPGAFRSVRGHRSWAVRSAPRPPLTPRSTGRSRSASGRRSARAQAASRSRSWLWWW